MSKLNYDKRTQKHLKKLEAEVEMVPTVMTKLTDPKQIEFMDKLVENLEDMDDVQNVWHNWEQE